MLPKQNFKHNNKTLKINNAIHRLRILC